MARLAQTPGLTEVQRDILATVRDFAEKEIIPHAQRLEHADAYPADIVEGMREMGLFGLTIAEEFGGLGESLLTYALVVEELSRGWMSISGIVNTHFIVAYLISQHGSAEQKARLLPKMATGEVRGAFSMSEPGVGSDVSGIRTRADRSGDTFVLNGQKMWLTNGGYSSVVATLVKTELGAPTVYGNMTTFLLEKEPGFGETAAGLTIPGKLEKMGYKGVETTEMILDGHAVPDSAVLGGVEAGLGRGFYQMMDGIEVGRVNVAARGCGVSLRAFELAVAYAQQRKAFGKPIAEYQGVTFPLAESAMELHAAHLMGLNVASLLDQGAPAVKELAMAKAYSVQVGYRAVDRAMQTHGAMGFTNELGLHHAWHSLRIVNVADGTNEILNRSIVQRLLKGDTEL